MEDGTRTREILVWKTNAIAARRHPHIHTRLPSRIELESKVYKTIVMPLYYESDLFFLSLHYKSQCSFPQHIDYFSVQRLAGFPILNISLCLFKRFGIRHNVSPLVQVNRFELSKNLILS